MSKLEDYFDAVDRFREVEAKTDLALVGDDFITAVCDRNDARADMEEAFTRAVKAALL